MTGERDGAGVAPDAHDQFPVITPRGPSRPATCRFDRLPGAPLAPQRPGRLQPTFLISLALASLLAHAVYVPIARMNRWVMAGGSSGTRPTSSANSLIFIRRKLGPSFPSMSLNS